MPNFFVIRNFIIETLIILKRQIDEKKKGRTMKKMYFFLFQIIVRIISFKEIHWDYIAKRGFQEDVKRLTDSKEISVSSDSHKDCGILLAVAHYGCKIFADCRANCCAFRDTSEIFARKRANWRHRRAEGVRRGRMGLRARKACCAGLPSPRRERRVIIYNAR